MEQKATELLVSSLIDLYKSLPNIGSNNQNKITINEAEYGKALRYKDIAEKQKKSSFFKISTSILMYSILPYLHIKDIISFAKSSTVFYHLVISPEFLLIAFNKEPNKGTIITTSHVKNTDKYQLLLDSMSAAIKENARIDAQEKIITEQNNIITAKTSKIAELNQIVEKQTIVIAQLKSQQSCLHENEIKQLNTQAQSLSNENNMLKYNIVKLHEICKQLNDKYSQLYLSYAKKTQSIDQIKQFIACEANIILSASDKPNEL